MVEDRLIRFSNHVNNAAYFLHAFGNHGGAGSIIQPQNSVAIGIDAEGFKAAAHGFTEDIFIFLNVAVKIIPP